MSQAELDRCDREIQEIQTLPIVQNGLAPAWLVTLGMNDWRYEKQLIQQEKAILDN